MMSVLEKRFWAKVDIRGEDECWNWKGYRKKDGYGLFQSSGFAALTHRFSYELEVGPIPDGLIICHKCDNPSCVNPNHLYAGTSSDNNHDMCRINVHNMRYATKRQCRTLLQAYKNNKGNVEILTMLAKYYGISYDELIEIVARFRKL